ncbi:hypothetical protein ONZ45_g16476 [Pleurotus djamor]|nr:hypothetical protein ONZ45_g16476 [Pleurotus djamor]
MQRAKGKRNSIGLAIVIFQYILSTAHFFMAFYQDITLLGGGDIGPFRDIQYHGKFAFTQVATEFFSCILADILLAWRTYVIYGRDRRILIAPAILILATFIATYGYVGASIQGLSWLPTPDFQGIFDQSRMTPISTWNILFMALSVATNVVLTTLTAAKLLLHHRTMKSVHGFSSLIFESAVIIESGLLYTLAWVVYLILFLLKSNGDIVAMDIIAQLAGIVPTLIIVTVAAGLSPVQTVSYRRPPRFSTANRQTQNDDFTNTDIHFSGVSAANYTNMNFSVNLAEQRTETSPTDDVKSREIDVKDPSLAV